MLKIERPSSKNKSHSLQISLERIFVQNVEYSSQVEDTIVSMAKLSAYANWLPV